MQYGFVKVAAVSPKVKVADVDYNLAQIKAQLDICWKKEASVVVFPELSLTGYSCADLFFQEALLVKARKALFDLAEYTEGKEGLVFVGLPLEKDGKLYNVAAALSDGEILGIVPKRNIPTYGWANEGRYFATGSAVVDDIVLEDDGYAVIPFGASQLFTCSSVEGLAVACEICEDLWVPNTPSTSHALAGANLIVNLAASNEIAGKETQIQKLVEATSSRLKCAYAFASAGVGESTQDVVFGGRCLVAENGTLLNTKLPFESGMVVTDVDIQMLRILRRKMSTFGCGVGETPLTGVVSASLTEDYVRTSFYLKQKQVSLKRKFATNPFLPEDPYEQDLYLEDVFETQARGLAGRYSHIGCKTAVLGISGGLDSTLALLVTVRAFDILGLDRKGIYAVTMPCFGTTDRTYSNACELSKLLGVTLKEVDIKQSVMCHFEDIGQNPELRDVTYENAQARERTQVLMDMANMVGGLVIGTGDLSELVLGWATYNGDHMSMYSVNSGVPKTMVRRLIEYVVERGEGLIGSGLGGDSLYGDCEWAGINAILKDVLATPVSPELLPPSNQDIAQKTEDLVGPYELHDFFLYYVLGFGFGPSKIFALAKVAFHHKYEPEAIYKWLKAFYTRFMTQQFKRSCLPDGPMVGPISVSPRCGLSMPSDASLALWMKEVEQLDTLG